MCDVAGGRSAIDAGRLVAALVAAGGDPGAQTKSSGAPLHWAAGCDDEAAMPLACAAARALIRAGADVDAADARGLNAIILAGATGNVRAVELLADAGADCGVIVGGGANLKLISAREVFATVGAPGVCVDDRVSSQFLPSQITTWVMSVYEIEKTIERIGAALTDPNTKMEAKSGVPDPHTDLSLIHI